MLASLLATLSACQPSKSVRTQLNKIHNADALSLYVPTVGTLLSANILQIFRPEKECRNPALKKGWTFGTVVPYAGKYNRNVRNGYTRLVAFGGRPGR